MKRWLRICILAFSVCFMVIGTVAPRAEGKTLLCRAIGIGCPQTIPGTSAEPPTEQLPTQSYDLMFRRADGLVPTVWVSTRFNKVEKTHIARGFGWLASRFKENRSALESCAARYGSTWQFPGSARGGRLTNNPVTNFSRLWNQATQKVLYIDYMSEPPLSDGGYVMGRAPVGIDWQGNGLRIKLNSHALRRSETSSYQAWGGIILHEIMHNLGYEHPEWRKGPQDVVGSLIYETGWCMTRNGQNKPPNSLTLVDGVGNAMPFRVD